MEGSLHFKSPFNNGQEWPFFRSMLDLIDVELGKSSPMITEHYESKTVQQVSCPTVELAGTAGTATSKFSGGRTKKGPRMAAKTPDFEVTFEFSKKIFSF